MVTRRSVRRPAGGGRVVPARWDAPPPPGPGGFLFGQYNEILTGGTGGRAGGAALRAPNGSFYPGGGKGGDIELDGDLKSMKSVYVEYT